MSALAAMQFDPTLAAMGTKNSFTWPGPLAPEPGVTGNNMLGNDFFTESEASMTPPSYSRSLTSSPPRLSFTPDNRDLVLKRQQDKIRRESKLSSRMRRTSSNSSSSFMDSPPMLPDVTMNMPVYTASPAALSLLPEPATSMPNQSYLSSYAPLPPMDQTSGQVFNTPYPSSVPGSFGMPMDYSTPYGAADYSARSSSSSLSLGADSMMYQMPAVMPAASGAEAGHVRVVQSRPKPRCWEHGCNGRQFSTFSNLLRHQREKSGQAAKASCPNCGAEFTRTTARNGHLLHDKCKQRRSTSADIKK